MTTEQKIRNRQSYKMLKELAEFIETKPTTNKILRRFLEELDAKSAFGSRTNADNAFDSLDQFIKDNKLTN